MKIERKKKNVLFVVDLLDVGGQTKLNLNIAKGTYTERYNFHLLTTWQATNLWQNKFKPYFQNIITFSNKDVKPLPYGKLDYKRFRFIINKLKTDLLIMSIPAYGYEYVPKIKSEFKNLKVIDIIHNETHPSIQEIMKIVPSIDKRVCISCRVKNHQVSMYNKLKMPVNLTDRLTVIYNSVETDKFKQNFEAKGTFKKRYSIHEDEIIIAFIGRFSKEKNPSLFVDIAELLLPKSPLKLKFVMAGEGVDLDTIKRQIHERGLDSHFVLTGVIDRTEELLNDTFLMLVTSRREGVPFVVLEAMSTGIPVISTNVGALNEIIEENISGFLINEKDENTVASFTNSILRLLQNKRLYDSIAEKARERMVSSFSLENMGTKYQSIMTNLLENDN